MQANLEGSRGWDNEGEKEAQLVEVLETFQEIFGWQQEDIFALFIFFQKNGRNGLQVSKQVGDVEGSVQGVQTPRFGFWCILEFGDFRGTAESCDCGATQLLDGIVGLDN